MDALLGKMMQDSSSEAMTPITMPVARVSATMPASAPARSSRRWAARAPSWHAVGMPRRPGPVRPMRLVRQLQTTCSADDPEHLPHPHEVYFFSVAALRIS